jgi:hypothetical protein
MKARGGVHVNLEVAQVFTEPLHVGPELGAEGPVVGAATSEGGGDGLGGAVAADQQRNAAAGRGLAHHADELLGAFDALAVVFEHHVAGLEASLFGGAVGLDAGDLDAAFFGKLEGFGTLGVNLSHTDAEIAPIRDGRLGRFGWQRRRSGLRNDDQLLDFFLFARSGLSEDKGAGNESRQ